MNDKDNAEIYDVFSKMLKDYDNTSDIGIDSGCNSVVMKALCIVEEMLIDRKINNDMFKIILDRLTCIENKISQNHVDRRREENEYITFTDL